VLVSVFLQDVHIRLNLLVNLCPAFRNIFHLQVILVFSHFAFFVVFEDFIKALFVEYPLRINSFLVFFIPPTKYASWCASKVTYSLILVYGVVFYNSWSGFDSSTNRADDIASKFTSFLKITLTSYSNRLFGGLFFGALSIASCIKARAHVYFFRPTFC